MKRKLLLFVLSQNAGTYFVQRGLYLCYPCALVDNGYPPAQALIDIFGRNMLYLCGTFPQPILVAETHRDADGNTKNFEFNGEPVIAVYYTPANVVNFFHDSPDPTSLERDIFVRHFEEHFSSRESRSVHVA